MAGIVPPDYFIGVWLAIALTDAVLVVITVSMMLSEFRKMPETVKAK